MHGVAGAREAALDLLVGHRRPLDAHALAHHEGEHQLGGEDGLALDHVDVRERLHRVEPGPMPRRRQALSFSD